MQRKRIILSSLIGLLLGLIIIIIYCSLSSPQQHTPSHNIEYKWEAGSAAPGKCSVPCGGGKVYRNVTCAAVNKTTGKIVKTVNNSYCSKSGTKPPDYQSCNTQPCTWQVGAWTPSDCPVSCGATAPNQHRSVKCEGGEDTNCKSPKPTTSQTCNSQQCKWVSSGWGSCNVSCGIDGIQTEQWHCPEPNKCGTKPTTTRPCSPAPPLCDWSAPSWPACPVPCGTASQTRAVSCERDGKSVSANNCSSTNKPPSSQTCDSANKCAWEYSGSYTFPPELLNLENITKKFKLLKSDNQYVGMGIQENTKNVGVGQRNASEASEFIIYIPTVGNAFIITSHDHFIQIDPFTSQLLWLPLSGIEKSTSILCLEADGDGFRFVSLNYPKNTANSTGYISLNSGGTFQYSTSLSKDNAYQVVPVLVT